jgi:hypothetical protein
MQVFSVRFLAVAPAVFCLSCWLGCSCASGPSRKAVYGKVTSARPVQAVTFRPVESLKAPAVTVEVKDGAYKFTRAEGPIPGDYEAIVQFADTDVAFTGSGKKGKEMVVSMPTIDPRTRRPVPPPEPPPPFAALPVTVPAKGPLEIDLTVP